MENLLFDLRFGLRTLLKNPAVSAVAILAIALGTGANSAIFSVVNAVVLRPLPYENPDRLVLVWGKNPTTARDAISVPDFLDYRNQNHVFTQMAGFAYDDFNLSTGDEPEHVQGTMVSANYFSVLGTRLSQGTTFRPEDDQPGANRVVIVGYGLWKRRFGSDPNFVGQPILLNGASFTVVGVGPQGFQSPIPEDNPQLWVPLSLDGGDRLRVPSTVISKKTRFTPIPTSDGSAPHRRIGTQALGNSALAGDCDIFVATAMGAVCAGFGDRAGNFVGIDPAIGRGLGKIP